MKKFFNTLVAVALAVAASASLTACGDDKDDPDEPDVKKTVKEATITSCFCVNQAMLDTYDIVATSFLGQELSFEQTPQNVQFSNGETIAVYPMVLNGSSNAVPFTSIMNISFTVKEGYEVPERSDFAIAAFATGVIEYTDGTTQTFGKKGYTMHNTGVMGDKIEGYTQLLNKRFGRIKVTLETDELEMENGIDED